MLRTRLITAAIMLPLLVAYVLKLPGGYFLALVCLVSTIALHEFYSMYRVSKPLMYTGLVLGVCMLITVKSGRMLDALLASAMLMAAIRLFAVPTPGGALSHIAPAVFGLVYVPALLSYQLMLHKSQPALVLFLFGAVWASDASAYFIGTKFGRHRLYESMSPKKSWEGAIASVVGGSLASLAMGAWLVKRMDTRAALLCGVMIGVFAVVGDLVESMLKRDAGVKDSGSLVPGHGGILDKIDSPLICGPLLYWLLKHMGVIGRFKFPF